MAIMVTGGAGFIGSMLCKLLVERGDDASEVTMCLSSTVCGMGDANSSML